MVSKPRPLRISGYSFDVGHAWVGLPSGKRYVSLTNTPLLAADVAKAQAWLQRVFRWQSEAKR